MRAISTWVALTVAVMSMYPSTASAQLPPELSQLAGERWVGFCESDVAGEPASVVPYIFHADVRIDSDGFTFERRDPGDYAPPTDITLESIAIDPQGWTELTVRSEVDWGGGNPTVEIITIPVAVTSSFAHAVYRQPDPFQHLGMVTTIPKADSLSAAVVTGTYMMFTHAFEIWDGTTATAKCGPVTFAGDGTYTATLDVSDGRIERPSGSWSTDDAERELILDGVRRVEVGRRGILSDFDYDWSDDVLDYSYFLKLGTGWVVAEASGYWLVQGFYSDVARLARTAWGTGLIDVAGNVALSMEDVDGASFAVAGALEMADDGTLTFADSTGVARRGAISEDGNLVVLADLGGAGDLGMTVLVRPVDITRPAPRRSSGRYGSP